VDDEAMSWIVIKLHIGAVRSLKDSDNGSAAVSGESTVPADRANAIVHLKVLRLRHCSLLTLGMLWNGWVCKNSAAEWLMWRT